MCVSLLRRRAKGRMIFHLSFHSERLVRRGGMLLEKHQAIGAGGWIGKFSNQSISILWPTHPQRAIKTVYVVGEENWFLRHKNWSGCNVASHSICLEGIFVFRISTRFLERNWKSSSVLKLGLGIVSKENPEADNASARDESTLKYE